MDLKKKIAFIIHFPLKSLRIFVRSIHRYFLTHTKYSSSEYILHIKGLNVKYSTKDSYSKSWFFSRYNNEKIHERIVTEMLINDLSNSQCFLDVGAHLGYFTCLASKVMESGYVYGFEMDKLSFNLLKKNIELNNIENANIYNYAVYDAEGIIKFTKLNRPLAELSISQGESSKYHQVISVRSISLDNFFRNKKLKPDIVKIDVEGAEMKVLKGMENLLVKNDIKLYLEIHPWKFKSFNTNSKEIISYLISMGYTVQEIEQHRSQKEREPLEYLKELSINSKFLKNSMIYAIKQD